MEKLTQQNILCFKPHWTQQYESMYSIYNVKTENTWHEDMT